MRKKIMRFAFVVSLFLVAFIGCEMRKKTETELRMEFFQKDVKQGSLDVNDYIVLDDGQMVIFSSVPIEGHSSIGHEMQYLNEYKKVMAAVSRWVRANPDTKVSIAVSERGGNDEPHQYNAYYTVRVVLLRE